MFVYKFCSPIGDCFVSMGIYDLVKIYVGKKFETKHDRAVNPILIGCNIYLRSNKE